MPLCVSSVLRRLWGGTQLKSRGQARQTEFMSPTWDVICIGGGPTGLAAAIEAKRAGMRALVLEKGCLCNSLYR